MGGVLSPGFYQGRRRRYGLQGKVIRIHGSPFLFQRRLGSGSFGSVYSAKAFDESKVAVKVIDLSSMPTAAPKLIESYLAEVRNLARLRQETDHVVRIFDFDFDARSGQAYIVMELGDEDLTTFIERSRASGRNSRGPGTYLEPNVRKQIWRQLVSIVATLTANNIIHLDLKPDNLIIFGRTIKIADLGIAKKVDKPHRGGVGTPYFGAPEVLQDSPGRPRYYGPKADIWSLGAILYYMTYGRPPKYSSRASEPPYGQSPVRDSALVDILRQTLVTNPHSRADIRTILRHPYTNY